MVNECDTIGIGGGCGTDCPVWLRGECAYAEEGMENYTSEELTLYVNIYGDTFYGHAISGGIIYKEDPYKEGPYKDDPYKEDPYKDAISGVGCSCKSILAAGLCGSDCPKWLQGKCNYAHTRVNSYTPEGRAFYREIYGDKHV